MPFFLAVLLAAYEKRMPSQKAPQSSGIAPIYSVAQSCMDEAQLRYTMYHAGTMQIASGAARVKKNSVHLR